MTADQAHSEPMLMEQPYPGLRPFEPDEALKFYGRETHTAELLRRLGENRFIAVVGSSGSGKSSLVRAGLLPALYRGRLTGATSRWRICIMRPGDEPLESLAEALAEQRVFSSARTAVLGEVRRSSLGLVRAVRASESQFLSGESLLLVVDQFEEIFRFVQTRREHDGGAEARLFVASLLEAAELSTAPVYVVLTMRSDFLGECSRFPGLPEALNRSQYLIPRMTREQVRDAIDRPLRLVDARMSNRLVEQLLNELGDDTGRLPVLQHALNRTFHEYTKNGAAGEIGVDDYVAAGELTRALNAHAEALATSLQQPWVERVFRCLTMVEGGRRVRRPTKLKQLLEISGAGDEESQRQILSVIRIFAHRDNAMLLWSGTALTEESVIDISHESLIENWTRLKNWVAIEAEASSLYLQANADAVRQRRGAASRWRGGKLKEACAYMKEGHWNEAWANRLSDSGATFPEVQVFIRGEETAQTEEDEEKFAAEKKAKEAAQALATMERLAKEAAEARATAERHEKEAAQALAETERLSKESALARAAAETESRSAAERATEAEREAKRAAEALARAERLKKRWLSVAALLGILALSLILWTVVPAYQQLKAKETDSNLIVQIGAWDDILSEYEKKKTELNSELARSVDPQQREKVRDDIKNLDAQAALVEKQRKAAAAALGKDSDFKTKVNAKDGLTYVWIPPGDFMMGCSPRDSECNDNEKPARPVQIDKGFWLAQTEVTQAAWRKVMSGVNPSNFTSDQLPADIVRWDIAADYCGKIGGRLPTETEWEYAARGGTTGPRYGNLKDIAWYRDNGGWTPHPVGLKQANAYGLYDMLGSVWEWTSDNYDPTTKVFRGGSGSGDSGSVRASSRDGGNPTVPIYGIGFRCVGELL